MDSTVDDANDKFLVYMVTFVTACVAASYPIHPSVSIGYRIAVIFPSLEGACRESSVEAANQTMVKPCHLFIKERVIISKIRQSDLLVYHEYPL